MKVDDNMSSKDIWKLLRNQVTGKASQKLSDPIIVDLNSLISAFFVGPLITSKTI